MADEYPTMLDLAKKHGADEVVGLVEQNLDRYPEAMLFPARTISGTSFPTILRTDYPEPSFRKVNEGTETKKNTYERKITEAYHLDGQLEVDEALDNAEDGGIDDELTNQANGMMKGALRKIGKQIWYGNNHARGDTLGFPGALQLVPDSLTVDATGSSDDTGSSVYLVLFGTQYTQLVFGRGNVLTMKPWTLQRVTRDSKHLMAFVSNISGWVGAQWFNAFGVGRIKDLTEDSGKGLTDALIADLMAKFPDDADMSNARLFMTRRSARQLQKSRSATSINNFGNRTATGVEVTAPWPTDSNGIPISITSSLINTEALT